MTTTHIPARKVTICDRCRVECTGENHAKHGAVHIKEAGLDFQGHAVGSMDRELDLCDSCLTKVAGAIAQAMKPDGGADA